MLVDQRVRQMFFSWTTFCSVVVVYTIHIQKQGYKVQFSKDYIRKIIIKKLKIFKSNTYCLKIHKLKMSFGILCQGYQISSLSLKNFFMSTKKKYIRRTCTHSLSVQ